MSIAAAGTPVAISTKTIGEDQARKMSKIWVEQKHSWTLPRLARTANQASAGCSLPNKLGLEHSLPSKMAADLGGTMREHRTTVYLSHSQHDDFTLLFIMQLRVILPCTCMNSLSVAIRLQSLWLICTTWAIVTSVIRRAYSHGEHRLHNHVVSFVSRVDLFFEKQDMCSYTPGTM